MLSQFIYLLVFSNVSGISYGTSKRGKALLFYGGYRYCVHYKKGSKVRWRCATNMNAGCRACMFFVENKIVKNNFVHNHTVTDVYPFVTYPAPDSRLNDNN